MSVPISNPRGDFLNYFSMNLENFNSFKADIHGQAGQLKPKIELNFSVQRISSNQNFNPYSKQILLQNSKHPSQSLINEDFCQYLVDRNDLIKNKHDSIDSEILLNQKYSPLRFKQSNKPLNKSNLQQQFKEKLYITKKKTIINSEIQPQIKLQECLIDNKESQRLPKRGLTFISKKLSQILRQKKHIKSNELFQIALFNEDEEVINQQQSIHIKNQNLVQKSLLGQQKYPQQLKEIKERRNVRRRIYDSINVMAALGIVKKKKNQFVYIQQKDDANETSLLIRQGEIISKKKDYLLKLKSDFLYKQRCLKYLTEAYSKMKILRRLNAEYEEKVDRNENAQTNTSRQSTIPQQKIQFPFVLFENGNNKNMKVELINDEDQQDPKPKKVNDWTDYIEVDNSSKKSQIQRLKIVGQDIKLISDVDCINMLGSLETQQHALTFQKYQSEILRDYEIISHHKQKKNEEANKSLNKN